MTKKIKIYVAFTSNYYPQEEKSNYKMLDFLIQTFHPPFGHCCIGFELKGIVLKHVSRCLRNPPLDSVLLCTSVSGKSGFKHGLFTFKKIGYSWTQLEAEEHLVEETLNIIQRMDERGTCGFSLVDMYGIPCLSDSSRPNREKDNWFCSQLTGFLLQKLGILEEQINCTKVSTTDVFLLIREHETYKSISCPLYQTVVKLKLQNKVTNADEIYKLLMKTDVIPLLNRCIYYD
jgi:hypothetical protein